jgi:hypothetical protein
MPRGSGQHCLALREEAYFDLSQSFFESAYVAGNDYYAGAFLCELFCDTEAHPLGGAGQENCLGVVRRGWWRTGWPIHTLSLTWNLFPPKRPMMDGSTSKKPSTMLPIVQ